VTFIVTGFALVAVMAVALFLIARSERD